MADITPEATRLAFAMRRLAKSVVIVTTRYNGKPMAMTATAVDCLSLDPPSVIFCMNRSSSMFEAIAEKAPFCVNVLAESHRGCAEACTKKQQGEARYEDGDWAQYVNGVPYLTDSLASIFCEQDGSMLYGSHAIFIGRVIDVIASQAANPLIYADRRYGRIELEMLS